MTTYAYDLRLNDSECIMLQMALDLTIEHCRQRIKIGDDVPFRAHKDSAEKVLARLLDNMHQTSSNNF